IQLPTFGGPAGAFFLPRSPKPAAIGTSTHATAKAANAFPGRRRPWRMGFSTNRNESQAGTRERAAAAGAANPRPGQRAFAKTIRGQCQRYQLYERSPIQTTGRRLSAREVAPGPAVPAAI